MAIRETSGGWQIDFFDQHGHRRRKTFRLRRDAERALRAARDAVDKGVFVPQAEVPTFAETAEQWFAGKTGLRPNTLSQYRIHLDNHLLPALGKLRLNQIEVERVERMRDELLADAEKKLGAQTINKVLTTAAAVFAYAQKRQRCVTNPAQLADRLKVSEEIQDEEGQTHRVSGRAVSDEDVLRPDEIQKLLAHATAGFPYTLLLTAAATGARHNELLALRWGDIDFVAGTIHVRRSLTWVKADGETKPVYYPPKTTAGLRKIPAPPELIHALKAWFLKSHFCSDTDLIFPTRTGEPHHHRNITRDVLQRTRKRAGLRQFTMHSLRHTFASSLLQDGASLAEVQRYMGHKSPLVTLAVYAHFLPTEDSGRVRGHVLRLLGRDCLQTDTSDAGAAAGAASDAVSA